MLEVARQTDAGSLFGYESENKFGENADIDANVAEDIWDGGGKYPFATSAETLEIVSDDADDTAAGAGARTVQVYGLGPNYVKQSVLVSMDGASAVILPGTWLRTFRMVVRTAGASGTNEGTIDLQVSVGGTVRASILPDNGQTLMAVYTVAAGETAASVNLFTRAENGAWNIKHAGGTNSAGSTWRHRFEPFFEIGEKTDIVLESTSDTVNTIVSGGFDLVCVDDRG
jgi:hypothetical protein